jgi:hypothetical protein
MMVFERIPLVIFRIIKRYLSHYEYLQLLNTSRYVFAELKYETVYYTLKILDNFPGRSTSILTSVDLVMDTIQKKVKSKRRQVCLKWYCESMERFSTFNNCFSEVRCLNLSFDRGAGVTLPLSCLSRIHSLTLYGICNRSLTGLSGNIETDVSGQKMRRLSGIRILKLERCWVLQDITEIEKMSALVKVKIRRCELLTDYSPVKNIKVVDAQLFFNDHGVQFYGPSVPYLAGDNQRSLTLSDDFYHAFQYELFTSLLSFRHLTNLSLEWHFNSSCDFIAAFGERNDGKYDDRYCMLKRLSLQNRSYHGNHGFHVVGENNNIQPVLPQLTDLLSITLRGFDVSSWNQPFSSLSTVKLTSCVIPSDLSCFKHVSSLSMSYSTSASLTFSEIFSNLKDLQLSFCNELTTLIINCNIKEVIITTASSLQHIYGNGSIKSFTIKGLNGSTFDKLIDFSFLRNVSSKFVLNSCPHFDKERYKTILKVIPQFG